MSKRAPSGSCVPIAWLLAGVMLFGVTAAATHGDSHGADDSTCSVCLYVHTLSWEPEAAPLPEAFLSRPLITLPESDTGLALVIVPRSRGPPSPLL